jgi:hypothetical protein
VNEINPELPTFVLLLTQEDYGFRNESGQFVTNPRSRIGHYEVVRSMHIGQANADGPDAHSPLYRTEALTAELDRLRVPVTRDEAVRELTAGTGVLSRAGERGRPKKNNPLESRMSHHDLNASSLIYYFSITV